jgi:glycogen debranching enzyme
MSLYTIDTFGQLQPFLRREWLLTNGLGGYASGTVVGCNIRKYHGLLIAATIPPVGRMNTLSRLGERVILDGDAEHPHDLAVNQFRDSFFPHGERYLQRFELENTATWTYQVNEVRIIKQLQLPWLKNIVGVRYTIQADGTRDVELRVGPFLSLRDFHSTRHASGYDMPAESNDRSVSVTCDDLTLHLTADRGTFTRSPGWWYGHVYQIETERGQDDSEDLFTPGHFTFTCRGNATFTIWAGLEPPAALDWETQLKRRREAVNAACNLPENIQPPAAPRETAPGAPGVSAGPAPLTIRKLSRAANDFVVFRKSPDGKPGTSIIAGYPWFADWGRDTMIALPGLLLVPRRFEQAKQVLGVFAQYVSQGMIPNRFNDYTNQPEYNTVDASLWFVHACFEYARLSKDSATFENVLKPACRGIIDGYQRGTRFGIRMDPADGLITQGDAHSQLTWMDAKCGDVAFTPRQGKAVEINALWYHALVLMGDTQLAKKVKSNFASAFWISPFRGLADVANSAPPDTYARDSACRPNQIFAASLTNSPLNAEQQSAVVEVVRRELLTPMGLRSLARGDTKYHGRYAGPQAVRDEAYHNGTVWAWLIGAFLDAYLKVNQRSPDALAQARRWLSPLIDQLDSGACLGQISEIYEGDDPHRPVGCCAQAWSVAEVLRLAVELGM